jgi:hypothetical protein
MKDIEVTALNNIEIELYEELQKLGRDIEALKKQQAAAHKLRTLGTAEQTFALCTRVFDKLNSYVAEQFQWVLSESAVVSESKLNSLRATANRTFNRTQATVNQHLLKVCELVDSPGLHKKYLAQSSVHMQKALKRAHKVLGDESIGDDDGKIISVVRTFFGRRKE